MRRVLFLVVTTTLFATCAAWAQGNLTESEIDEAINMGENAESANKLWDQLDLHWHYGGKYSHGIMILGPFQRLTMQVFNKHTKAIKEYEEYELTDEFINELTERTVSVTAMAPEPYLDDDNGWQTPGHAKNMVVLRLEKGKEVGEIIRPVRKEIIPHEWQNSFGMQITGASITAEFDYDVFPQDSDIRIVVITDEGGVSKYDIKQSYLTNIK